MIPQVEFIEIPAQSARAVTLVAGDVVSIIDVNGGQVADVVAFLADGSGEHFSQGMTRMWANRADISTGDLLMSNTLRPLLEIIDDTVGNNDLWFPPCNQIMYGRNHGLPDKRGCREQLSDALLPFGIEHAQVTDPFNVFMNTRVDESQTAVILDPRSRAGDHVDLLARASVVVAVSACPYDILDEHGWVSQPLRLEVRRAAPAGS